MHTQSLDRWQHAHVFLGEKHDRNERRTQFVIALTAAMMVGEIVAGTLFRSMALVADGWHMSTHAGALAISAFAYGYARRHAHDPRFAFGTGKLGDLAGFTSAVILALIAALIAYESLQRLLHPVPIAFQEAIAVAVLGLAVNVVSAWLLHDRDDHHHGHDHHGHDHPHAHAHDDRKDDAHRHHHHRHHVDHNLRSAYVHVIADAATSVLATSGLLAGWLFGWTFMDPVMGIVGAGVILNWSYTLVRDTSRVLLDVTADGALAGEIRRRLEGGGDRVADLHLWRIGPGHCGAIVSLVTDEPRPPATYKARLSDLGVLSHLTVEVQACEAHG